MLGALKKLHWESERVAGGQHFWPSVCHPVGTYKSECDIRENLDTNESLYIFDSKNLHERISEYIRIKNLTQTDARISIRLENCMNIRIFV